jgi:hypothetical protein
MTLSDLEKAFGNDNRIAEAIGVSRQLVAYWRAHGGTITPQRQALIELRTGGRFKASVGVREKARKRNGSTR